MPAFFSTFVASEHNEDGVIGLETELTVTNETDQPIYQLQYKFWCSDPGGATFWEDGGCDDVYLAPGDQHNFSPWAQVNQRDLNGSSISMRVLGRLARRDFRVLGEVAIPGPGESARLQASLDLGWSSGPITVLVSRSAPDEDGVFNLEYKALIENKSSQFLEAVTLTGQLIDAEGVEIKSEQTQQPIPPESAVLYYSSFYNAKAGQLIGAKAIFSLKALIPVATFDASETTEVGEE